MGTGACLRRALAPGRAQQACSRCIVARHAQNSSPIVAHRRTVKSAQCVRACADASRAAQPVGPRPAWLSRLLAGLHRYARIMLGALAALAAVALAFTGAAHAAKCAVNYVMRCYHSLVHPCLDSRPVGDLLWPLQPQSSRHASNSKPYAAFTPFLHASTSTEGRVNGCSSAVAERAPDAVAAPSAQAAAAQAGAEISEGNPKEEFPNTSKRWEHGGAVQTYHGIDYPLVMHKFRPHVHKRALQQLSALHKRLRSRCLRQGSMLMVCKPAARLQLAAHYSQRSFFQDIKEILNKPNVFKLLASTI